MNINSDDTNNTTDQVHYNNREAQQQQQQQGSNTANNNTNNTISALDKANGLNPPHLMEPIIASAAKVPPTGRDPSSASSLSAVPMPSANPNTNANATLSSSGPTATTTTGAPQQQAPAHTTAAVNIVDANSQNALSYEGRQLALRIARSRPPSSVSPRHNNSGNKLVLPTVEEEEEEGAAGNSDTHKAGGDNRDFNDSRTALLGAENDNADDEEDIEKNTGNTNGNASVTKTSSSGNIKKLRRVGSGKRLSKSSSHNGSRNDLSNPSSSSASASGGGAAARTNSQSDLVGITDKHRSSSVFANASATLMNLLGNSSIAAASSELNGAGKSSQQPPPPPALDLELQIETTSSVVSRIIFYGWYLLLILAILLQVIITLQWECKNVCDGDCGLLSLGSWRSGQCSDVTTSTVQKEIIINNTVVNVTDTVYDLSWSGSVGYVADEKLSRFVHVVIVMPRPNVTHNDNIEIPLRFALNVSNVAPNSEEIDSGDTVATATLRCVSGESRCDAIFLNTNIAQAATNESDLTIVISDAPKEVMDVSNEAGVAYVFQNRGYTIATICVRYICIFFSLIHLIRFVYHKTVDGLYEQTWVIVLHFALFLFLDPLFAGSVYLSPAPSVFSFIEFRMPIYFIATFISFMFSVITSAHAWASDVPSTSSPSSPSSSGSNNNGTNANNTTDNNGVSAWASIGYASVDGNDTSNTPNSHTPSPTTATSTTSPHNWSISMVLYDPPIRTKFIAIAFIAVIVVLDIIDGYINDWDWASEHCPDFKCSVPGFLMYILIGLGVVVCSCWLWWLRGNLGQKPYFACRAQQLAFRIFVIVFVSAVLYLVVQTILVFAIYHEISPLVSFQILIQIGPVLVLAAFVNIMTYVYTSTLRTGKGEKGDKEKGVPIRPMDPLWKETVWEDRWYRWLALHGGSMYMFASEAEEQFFDFIQAQDAYKKEQMRKYGYNPSSGSAFLDGHSGVGASARLSSAGGSYRHNNNNNDHHPHHHHHEEGVGDDDHNFTDTTEESGGGSPTSSSRSSAVYSAGGGGAKKKKKKNNVFKTMMGHLRLSPHTTSRDSRGRAPSYYDDEMVFSIPEWRLDKDLTPFERKVREYEFKLALKRKAEIERREAELMTRDEGEFDIISDEGGAEGGGGGGGDYKGGGAKDYKKKLLGGGGRGGGEGADAAAPNYDSTEDTTPERQSTMSKRTSSNTRTSGGGGGSARRAPATAKKPFSPLGRKKGGKATSFNGSSSSTASMRGGAGSSSTHNPFRTVANFGRGVVNTIVDAPNTLGEGLGRIEDGIMAMGYALGGQGPVERKPFFNLEVCVDLFNLSWEVYGRPTPAADIYLITDAQHTLNQRRRANTEFSDQKPLWQRILCCFKWGSTKDDEEDSATGATDDMSTALVTGDDTTTTTNANGGNHHHRQHGSGGGVGAAGPTDAAFLLSIDGNTAGLASDSSTLPNGGDPTTTMPARPINDITRVPLIASTHNTTATSSSATKERHFAGERPVSASTGPNQQQGGGGGGGLPTSSSSSNITSSSSQAAAAAAQEALSPPICTEQYGYELAAVHEALDVQIIIAVMDTNVRVHRGKNPRIVVAFRGSTNLSNFEQDVRFTRVRWTEMPARNAISDKWVGPTVHQGFLNVWSALRHFVLTEVQALHRHLSEKLGPNGPTPRVYLTGHSLGGAVATLCAYALKKTLRIEPIVYTFGQPIVGNKGFKDEYNREIPKTFRVVNESDMVVNLTQFGGHHVGIEAAIDRMGNFICEPMFLERWLRPTQGKGFAAKNHMLGAYGASLNAIVHQGRFGHCPIQCQKPYFDPHERSVIMALASRRKHHELRLQEKECGGGVDPSSAALIRGDSTASPLGYNPRNSNMSSSSSSSNPYRSSTYFSHNHHAYGSSNVANNSSNNYNAAANSNTTFSNGNTKSSNGGGGGYGGYGDDDGEDDPYSRPSAYVPAPIEYNFNKY